MLTSFGFYVALTMAAGSGMDQVTVASTDLRTVNAGRLGNRVSGQLTLNTPSGPVTVHLNAFHTRPAHVTAPRVGDVFWMSTASIQRGSITISDLHRRK
jgi:hypothetical protein